MKLLCMKKLRLSKIVLPITLLLSMLHAPAQSTVSLTGAGNEHDIESWLNRNKLRNFGDEKNFVGDRFFNSNWLPGSLETFDGKMIRNIDLKYDVVLDQLILKNKTTPLVVKTSSVGKFILNHDGEKLLFEVLVIGDQISYYQVLHRKESQLLVKHSTKIVKRDAGTQAYGSGVAYDKYVPSKEYYASKGDNPPVPLKISKKSIAGFLSDHDAEVIKFIKSNKVDLKSDEGVASIFNYYDQLK